MNIFQRLDLITFLGIVLCLSSRVAAADSTVDLPAQVRQAMQWYQQGDFQRAADAFQSAQDAMPEEPRLKFDRACALLAAGQPEAAIELWQEVAVTRDRQLASLALYNLGCRASDQAKTMLGETPESLAPNQRAEVLALFASAATQWRRCLDLNPVHESARNNLEVLRASVARLQQVWRDIDRQKLHADADLLTLLQQIDDHQSALRDETRQRAKQPESVARRLAIRQLANRQSQLGDQIVPLQEKLAAAVTESLAQAEVDPNSPPAAALAQAMARVSRATDSIKATITQSAETLRRRRLAPVDDLQRDVLDQLNELYLAVGPLPAILQKSIQEQSQLVAASQSLANNSSAQPQANSPIAATNPTDHALDSDAAWRQHRVSRWATAMPPKAEAMLAQLPESHGSAPSTLQDSPEPESPNDGALSLETITPADVPAETDKPAGEEPAEHEVSDFDVPERDEQQEAADRQQAQLRSGLQKAIELGPQIEQLTASASDDVLVGAYEIALPKQERALELLREIAAHLPQPPPEQDSSNQDQSQQQDSSQGQEQDSQQQGQDSNPPADEQQGKQQGEPQNDQHAQNEQQQSSQSEQSPGTEDERKPVEPKATDDNSNSKDEANQLEDESSESPQPRDDDAKQDEASPSPKDSAEKPQAALPDDKDGAEATDKDSDQEQSTQPQTTSLEQREYNAVMSKARQQERRYREAQKRLRALIYGPIPVDQDW